MTSIVVTSSTVSRLDGDDGPARAKAIILPRDNARMAALTAVREDISLGGPRSSSCLSTEMRSRSPPVHEKAREILGLHPQTELRRRAIARSMSVSRDMARAKVDCRYPPDSRGRMSPPSPTRNWRPASTRMTRREHPNIQRRARTVPSCPLAATWADRPWHDPEAQCWVERVSSRRHQKGSFTLLTFES